MKKFSFLGTVLSRKLCYVTHFSSIKGIYWKRPTFSLMPFSWGQSPSLTFTAIAAKQLLYLTLSYSFFSLCSIASIYRLASPYKLMKEGVGVTN